MREWVSPEGLRQDGRRAKELRRVVATLGVLPHADGSARLEMGNTKAGDWWGTGGGRFGGGGSFRGRAARRGTACAASTPGAAHQYLAATRLQVLAAVFGPRVPSGRGGGSATAVDVRCEVAAASFATASALSFHVLTWRRPALPQCPRSPHPSPNPTLAFPPQPAGAGAARVATGAR